MNQPELGKKIAELRKAKGLTQDELVEQCNISVRTLQRIESGEVMPRSYTLRIIFSALGYSAPPESGNTGTSRMGLWYRQLPDVLNLKSFNMKMILIFLAGCVVVAVGWWLLARDTRTQKAAEAVTAIEETQKKLNHWLDQGLIDSVMLVFRADANSIPNCSDKLEIREMLREAIAGGYRVIDFKNLSISVADTIAVQKYYVEFEFSGNTFRQKGLTEWRLTNGVWLIVNDIANNY